jgi:hypothetical protein
MCFIEMESVSWAAIDAKDSSIRRQGFSLALTVADSNCADHAVDFVDPDSSPRKQTAWAAAYPWYLKATLKRPGTRVQAAHFRQWVPPRGPLKAVC